MDDYTLKDVPLALVAGGTRNEFDSTGTVQVPTDKYYRAQTARALVHFSIGDDCMPEAFYHTYSVVKKACACQALEHSAEGRHIPEE
jgi:fumarate hydratase class II